MPLKTGPFGAAQAHTLFAAAAGWGRRIADLGRVLLAAALIAVAQLSPVALAQGSLNGTAVEESRERVLASGRYQVDRPEPPELEEREEPLELPLWLVEAILWFIGAIVVAMILVFLFNALQNRSGFRIHRDRERPEPDLVQTPVRTRPRAEDEHTLRKADALAAEGRFTEAIHLLLLVAMDRLKQDLGARVAPALTGREVLGLAPIPTPAVEPLGRMVTLSEIKHFGGRDAARPDYDQCRHDFLRFSGLDEAQ